MKVDEKHVLMPDKYEGGEDVDAPPEEQPQGKKSRKDHYNEKYPGYKATDSGLNHDEGMNYNRSCTDFLCLVLFLAFLASMVSIAIYSLVKGDPKALYKPYDGKSRICGFDEDVKDYGKLYMTQIDLTFRDGANAAQGRSDEVLKRIIYENAVCVKSCPNAKSLQIACPPDQWSQDQCQASDVVIYETHSFLDICVPVLDKVDPRVQAQWNYVFGHLKENPAIEQIENLANSWKALTFSIFSALLISVIYIFFLSAFAEYLAWALIFLIGIGLFAFSGVGFVMYTSYASSAPNKSKSGLVMGIVFLVVACLFALLVYCGWNKLAIAIEVIDVSADFLAGTKRLMLVPFMYYVILMIFFLFYLASVFSVESMATITPDPDNDGGSFIPLKKSIDWNDKGVGKTANIFLAFLTFGLIWVTFFLSQSNNYVTLVSASTFYFSSNRETWGSGKVMLALNWAWVHNIGSIAFGSLIIAIMFTVRMIVYYACKQAEKSAGENPAVKIAICLANCILKCIEEILEYINKTAYAFMAISGESFCPAALHGLILNLNHGAEFAFANFLAAMFMLLGKVGLTILNTVLTYFYIKKTTPPEETASFALPLTIVFLTTYMLVSVFIGMFDEVVFGMLTCLSADLDLHGGDNKFGPKSLHELIDNINGVEGSDKDHKETNEIQ